MLLADGMKGASQRILDLADDGIDPFELGDLDTVRAAAGDDYLVRLTGLAKGTETAKAVRDNCGTRGKVVGGPGF